MIRFNGWAAIAAVCAISCTVSPSLAQTVDPALAKSWAFMQEQMPGVPLSLLQAACKEGAVTIYHSTIADAARSQIKHFTDRFPCVKVQDFELGTGTLRERFLSESRSGRDIADITQDADPGALDKEAKEGLLTNYVISNDRFYPESVKRSGYWYPLHMTLISIAWNTNLVSDAEAQSLQQWKGVLDPAWAGKSAVVDPSVGGANLMVWYAWTKMFGDDAVHKIAAQKPRIFGAGNTAASSLASGDVAVVLNASEATVVPIWSQGAPIHWALPEPAVGPPLSQVIAAHSPHPNAAKLYQEYAFSAEGYAAWQKFGGPPARIDYKDQRDVVSESWYKSPTKFFAYNLSDLAQDGPKVIDLVHRTVGAFR